MKKLKEYLDLIDGLNYRSRLSRILDCDRLSDAFCVAIESGLFVNISDWDTNEKGEQTKTFDGEDTKFFVGQNDDITRDISLKTYYIFHKNVCLVSEHSKRNTILRVILRAPDTDWKIEKNEKDGSFIFLPDKDVYYEIFTWWNMDWLNNGHRDVNTNYISGAWNKTIFNQIEELFGIINNCTAAKKFEARYNGFCSQSVKVASFKAGAEWMEEHIV